MPAPTLHTPANPVIEVDVNGLPIDTVTTTSGRSVVGNVASGATDAGNPVKVGGEYLATTPTFANGQRTDLQTSANGSVYVDFGRAGNNRSPTADGLSVATGINTYSQTVYFNGTTWDRARGDANGSWVGGNVASGANDAGNPVKVGGVFNTSPPTLSTGQRGNLQLTANGILRVINTNASGGETTYLNWTNAALDTTTITSFAGVSLGYVINPSTGQAVRALGDATGSIVHAPTNTVSSALSNTIAASGGTATVAFINTARQEVINPSTAAIWASWGTPGVNAAGSFQISPGGSFSTDRTSGTLTLLSTVASQPFTVNRYS